MDEPVGVVQPPTPEKPSGEITSDDKTMAMLAHLLGIVIGFVGPLIIWLIKKDQSKFVDYHGKEALNFQITVLIGYIVSSILSMVLIGCITGVIVWIASLIWCIIGGMAANKGEYYKYPITLRLIK